MKIEWNRCLEVEHKVQRILVQQEIDGIQFDTDRAKSLVGDILAEQQDIYDYIRPRLKVEVESSEGKLDKPVTFNGVTCDAGHPGFLKSIFLKNGDYSKSVNTWAEGAGIALGDGVSVCGPFTRITFVEPELSKREKLARQLIRLGWKPETFTETGVPKLTDKGVPVESLERIEGDVGQKLARWFVLGHRLGLVNGLISGVRGDGRIPSLCTGAVTNTFRRRHKLVANLPRAEDGVVYGKEIRGLFIATPGNKLIGFDQAALEGRIFGHYTFPYDNGEFANELLQGDIHSKNKDWISKIFPVTRTISKNIFYGVCYGAQYPKIQAMLGCSEKQAKAIFDKFWKENYALGQLRDKVIKIGERYGYLPGIDGRKIHLRGSPHSFLNALFQSAGAIACNYSMVKIHEKVIEENIPGKQVWYYHDEWGWDVPSDTIFPAENINNQNLILDKSGKLYSRLGEIAIQSIREVGKELNLRVELNSDYQIGDNWGMIH